MFSRSSLTMSSTASFPSAAASQLTSVVTRAPLFNWLSERSAGVLLHPTALPGSYGVGGFDGAAVQLLEFCAAAGIRSWQLCPLGPTGYGDSPYQCFSAFG